LTPTPPDSEDERIQAQQDSNAQEEQEPPSSATEMPVPTEWPSPTSPEDPEDDFGEMIEINDDETPVAAPAERHMGAPAGTNLQPLLPPKEFEPLKRRKQEVAPKPADPAPRPWPTPTAAPAEQHKGAPVVEAKRHHHVPADAPSYSRTHQNRYPPVMGIAISDFHKVLDTERGHILRRPSHKA